MALRFAPNRPRAPSLVGEATLWLAAIFVAGLGLVAAASILAERSAARNLADFGMIDFFQEEVEPAIRICRGDEDCLQQIYQNETGGLWSVRAETGRRHNSFSFALSEFGVFGRGLDACERSEAREVGDYALFTCVMPESGLGYRVALRKAETALGWSALVALEAPGWRRKIERALDHYLFRRSFGAALIAVAATLAAALGVAALLLRHRLRGHFDRLSAAIDAYRGGARRDMPDGFPREVQSLVASLNRAVDRSDELAARQRRNVHKMAHDLRHQLVSLDAAFRDGADAAVDGDVVRGDAVQGEVERMRVLIERYLTLVDWVGPAESQPPIRVAPALEDARRAFSRRLRATSVEIEVDCPEELTLRMNPTDLNVILSNLVSNAHRHAAGRIRLSAAATAAGVALRVEDDGPGVPEAERDRALDWGERLDHALPGSGFGLAIVAEQVRDLYQGEARLGRSPLGGLLVEILLRRR